MEPISEEMGFEADLRLGSGRSENRDSISEPGRELAFKSGFLSLQERLSNWNKQARPKRSNNKNLKRDEGENSKIRDNQQHHQFATLHEFFQSKSSLRKQLEKDAISNSQKKPKIPIMKLSKADWNVRCWEDRLRASKGGKRDDDRHVGSRDEPKRPQKPELQVEVFNGRIDEVAKKLEKTREGAPLDEQLYKLERNKLREPKREHSWTDQLKRELSEGLHDRKVLKSEILKRQATKQQGEPDEPSEGQTSDTSRCAGDRRPVVLSPLGRPIGRILDDDDDD